MNSRISGWCRLSYIGFLCIASVMAGCAGGSPGRTETLKSGPSNVQIGKASYNQSAHGFEEPWPFGAGPGAGVDD
jgi:hypothetical protein